MNQNKLLFGRAIFTLIIIVSFGLIIMNEKGYLLFSKKAEKKINDYLDENYTSLSNITKSSVSYDNNQFKMKISSKDNNNHYFYIIYSNKKITDTYQEDYVEGKKLLEYTKKLLEEKINDGSSVSITATLDNYSEIVQERIIKNDNLLSLKFYIITKELKVDNLDYDTIYNRINDYISKCNSNNITPKSYSFTIIDQKDITKSIKISNITEDNLSVEAIKEALDKKEEKKIIIE